MAAIVGAIQISAAGRRRIAQDCRVASIEVSVVVAYVDHHAGKTGAIPSVRCYGRRVVGPAVGVDDQCLRASDLGHTLMTKNQWTTDASHRLSLDSRLCIPVQIGQNIIDPNGALHLLRPHALVYAKLRRKPLALEIRFPAVQDVFVSLRQV